MIPLQNAARAAALAGNLNSTFSGPSVNASIQDFTESFTVESTDIVGTTADSVPLTCDGYALMELGRIRLAGLITNALNISVKLQRVALGFLTTASMASGSPTVTSTNLAGLLIGQSVAGSGIAVAQSFSAGTTNASTTVTTTQLGIVVGQVVSGTGITTGTTVATVTPGTGFTLSAAATATNAVVVLSTAAPVITAITATGFTMNCAAQLAQTVNLTLSGAADITAAQVAAAGAGANATAAQVLPFVPIDGRPVQFLRGDRIRMVITAVTSLGIGRTLLPSIPFISRFAPGITP